MTPTSGPEHFEMRFGQLPMFESFIDDFQFI
jgi:hypothetical protein